MSDDLRDLYQEVILDHGKNPRRYGKPQSFNHTARGENPMCGDKITLYLTVDEAGRIADMRFDGRGCAISQASASLMGEVIVGKTVQEAERLFDYFHELCTKDDDERNGDADMPADALESLAPLSGVREFPMRVKCATLAWHALRSALHGGGVASSESAAGF
jgi:nitrogen fixation protein NifU and related proteins